MFASEQVKYSLSFPAEEFKGRDVSTPLSAARLIYDVDLQYGERKEIALSILATVFQQDDVVLPIIKKCNAELPSAVDGEAWKIAARLKRQARLMRHKNEMRRDELLRERHERRLSQVLALAEVSEQRPASAVDDDEGEGGLELAGEEGAKGPAEATPKKQRRRKKKTPAATGATPSATSTTTTAATSATTSATTVSSALSFSTAEAREGSPLPASRPLGTGAEASTSGGLEMEADIFLKLIERLDASIGQSAAAIADLESRGDRFSPEEEKRARSETSASPSAFSWNECLSRILVAAVRADSVNGARQLLTGLATGAIGRSARDGRELLVFAWTAEVWMLGEWVVPAERRLEDGEFLVCHGSL